MLQGLDLEEAAHRLRTGGPNLLAEDGSRTGLTILVGQVANLPTALLLGSSVLSLAIGDLLDAAVIGTVVGLNAAVGYHIERRSEEILAAWRKLEAGTATVVRSGRMVDIAAADLVAGDLLICRAGDVLAADARVVDAHRLTCDEAALTGESEPQPKGVDPVAAAAPLAERSSMLFKGTSIVSGHGRAVVTATGRDTEVARVRELIEGQRAPVAPLQRKLGALGRWASLGGVSAAALSGAAGLLWMRPPLESLRGSVALGVAAIPEGLPVTATAALVRAMGRMRDHGVVVRRLSAAETLGGVTVVCVDKTGTLTRNRMRLELVDLLDRVVPADQLTADLDAPLADPLSRLLAAGVLNSDIDLLAEGKGDVVVSGSATEQALVLAARAAGLDPAELRRRFPRRRLVERNGGVHYVISEHDGAGGRFDLVKGAPEQVFALCERDVTGRARAEWLAHARRRNAALAARGLRVLAAASRQAAAADGPGWTLLGLVALRDPLRPGSADAVRAARRAGIRTIILTGDQRPTAEAIARELGLDGEVIDGGELARLLADGAPEAAARLARVVGLSRVTPADKLAVIEALRRQGEIVAMAGDGINDAPALKAADVGIAVGAGSSDLARQTADVVLAEADLRAILSAIGEGRIVQDNLRRAVRFLLATNLSEVALVLGGALLGRAALAPLQLLWINLITDTLPALALALESGDPEVLDRPPASPDRPILDRSEWRGVARDAAAMSAVSGAALAAGGQVAAFSTLTASQLGYAVAVRQPDSPSRRRFAGLFGGALALQVAGTFLGPVRSLLRLPSPTPLAVAGMAVGLLGPWLLARDRGEIVVRSPSPQEVTS